MKRKILYIEPVVSEMVDSWEEYLSKFKSPNTELEVTSLPEGPRHLEYYSYGPLVVPQILKMIKKAERDNFDGVIIGCFYDPGLREAREIAEKLVVTAPAEASMHIAATLGQRFSIIVGRTKWIPLMRENVIKYGFQDHLASFRAIGMGVLDLQVDPEETKRRIAQAAERAIESDGAEVIILGCTHQFGFYQELQGTLRVPVIDVACAALNYAEFLIDLRDKHGWYFNKKNEYLPPPREEIEAWKLSELF
ncbi:aspartate/glutamate racemase family protein [Thermanaerothrix sp.]|uniref:aspartate/glutamate racemase family protein n=1 Tax=Thermanaerothrix sp. TaxID=2972675 RepID=UPI003C7B05F4